MMPNDISSDARLPREADFHDRTFAENTRAATDRFYSVARRAYDRYSYLTQEGVAGLRVLEYGCGPGSESFALAAAGAEVNGIDISPVAIEMARQAASQRGVSARCHFEIMNAEALKFPTASFDRICGSGILHHLDIARSFQEISRTLKPGGRAIFIEPLGHNPVINWYRRRTPEMRTTDEHPLLSRDLSAAARHFRRVNPEFLHLSVLATAAITKSHFYPALHRALDRFDNVLLSKRSPMRWAAWLVIVVLEK